MRLVPDNYETIALPMPRTYHKAKPDTASSWDRPAIIAALSRRGWSIRRLSVEHGYSPKSLGLALRQPWLRSEKIIADTIGVSAEEIWPARYAKRSGQRGDQ